MPKAYADTISPAKTPRTVKRYAVLSHSTMYESIITSGTNMVLEITVGRGQSHLFLIFEAKNAPAKVAKEPTIISSGVEPIVKLEIKHPINKPGIALGL